MHRMWWLSILILFSLSQVLPSPFLSGPLGLSGPAAAGVAAEAGSGPDTGSVSCQRRPRGGYCAR